MYIKDNVLLKIKFPRNVFVPSHPPFISGKEAVFSNVSVFNDTCIKWHRESERTQSEEMFVVSPGLSGLT